MSISSGRRAVGRPWSSEEDEGLKKGVEKYGHTDMWKTIAAEFVPSRTNKACRKRWLHSLSPTLKKSGWSAEEDELLLALYKIHGTRWAIIARHIPGRTDDACSKRYREALDPNLIWSEWSEQEDQRLYRLHTIWNGKWSKVGQDMGRSSLSCRNRWRLLERRRQATMRIVSSSPSTSAERWNFLPSSGTVWESFSISELHDHQRQLDILTEMGLSELERFPFRTSTLENALSTRMRDTGASSMGNNEGMSLDRTNKLDAMSPGASAQDVEERSMSTAPLSRAENPPSPMFEDPPDSQWEGQHLEDTSEGQNNCQNARGGLKAPILISCYESHRLSSIRPVEGSLQPYSCGHPACWPVRSSVGNFCFSTSKELSLHVKGTHGEDGSHSQDKVYRCALPNCGKSWKTVNGLQYHLQVSRAHFKDAISKSLLESTSTSQAQKDLTQKRYACPHPGCPNEYKQSSGLRYHLAHGHSHNPPAQLSTLPPHLAARIRQL